MPNTLAHMGIQSIATRGVSRAANPGWVWLGCILPDIPWIMQRGALAVDPALSPYDVRFYAVVQSSFLISCIAAGAFASLASSWRRTFLILVLGILLHLLLDATQTKLANGVLLAAPFDWHLLNFRLYWPEGLPSLALTLLGAVVFAWYALRPDPEWFAQPATPLPRSRWIFAAVFAGVYLVLPLAFMPAAERADVHYAGTLRDEAARPGRYVEFDRSSAGIAPDGTAYLQPWTQERIQLTGTPLPEGARVVSLRGRFDDTGALEVETLHVHAGRRRDVFTYLGLLLCLGWWSYAAWRRFGPKV